jgi:hypothetical protein
MTAAGYQAVQAYPLRWHGHTLGTMNAFRTEARPPESDTGQLGQALADIATVVIVQTASLAAGQVTDRVQQALAARTAIEQAKGVLAYTRRVDMATAYELLRSLAAEHRASISATAAGVIFRARRPEAPGR